MDYNILWEQLLQFSVFKSLSLSAEQILLSTDNQDRVFHCCRKMSHYLLATIDSADEAEAMAAMRNLLRETLNLASLNGLKTPTAFIEALNKHIQHIDLPGRLVYGHEFSLHHLKKHFGNFVLQDTFTLTGTALEALRNIVYLQSATDQNLPPGTMLLRIREKIYREHLFRATLSAFCFIDMWGVGRLEGYLQEKTDATV